MFNEIENRTIYGIINKQNVITIKDFEEAYNNRGSIKIFEDLSLDNKKILLIGKKWNRVVFAKPLQCRKSM